jgi:hypothetical protein
VTTKSVTTDSAQKRLSSELSEKQEEQREFSSQLKCQEVVDSDSKPQSDNNIQPTDTRFSQSPPFESKKEETEAHYTNRKHERETREKVGRSPERKNQKKRRRNTRSSSSSSDEDTHRSHKHSHHQR